MSPTTIPHYDVVVVLTVLAVLEVVLIVLTVLAVLEVLEIVLTVLAVLEVELDDVVVLVVDG